MHGLNLLYETFISFEHHTAMAPNDPAFWKDRARASAIHLCLSLVIAALAALLVFAIWYPYPYREISGGRELFLIVVSVDVILGPLITLAVFDRRKPLRELRRDLGVVVLLQFLALGYGLWTVSVARPVHLVFEYDRYRVVHAIEIPQDLLDKTPSGLTALPWTGPSLLSLRPFRSEEERVEATMVAIKGIALSARPDLWQSYAAGAESIRRQARPLADLKARFPGHAAAIDAAVASTRRSAPALAYMPMVGRKSFWTVLLDPASTEVLAFIPLDSF